MSSTDCYRRITAKYHNIYIYISSYIVLQQWWWGNVYRSHGTFSRIFIFCVWYTYDDVAAIRIGTHQGRVQRLPLTFDQSQWGSEGCGSEHTHVYAYIRQMGALWPLWNRNIYMWKYVRAWLVAVEYIQWAFTEWMIICHKTEMSSHTPCVVYSDACVCVCSCVTCFCYTEGRGVNWIETNDAV